MEWFMKIKMKEKQDDIKMKYRIINTTFRHSPQPTAHSPQPTAHKSL